MADSSDYVPRRSGPGTRKTAAASQINRRFPERRTRRNCPSDGTAAALLLATPNGQKVTILLEELLARGQPGAEYDAWLIRIGDVISSAAVSWRSIRTRRFGARGSQRT